MKIGVFTDVHYCNAEVMCKTRRPLLSSVKIREAMEAFRAAKVDLCICLGDLTDLAPGDTKPHAVKCLHDILALIRSYNIPFCLVPGNHDFLVLKREDFCSAGVQVPPYAISANGYRLIFLDANYRSDMRHFDMAGEEWTDANLPREQCRFLEDELNAATEPCIVCIHENLDPSVENDYIVKNADEIREIIKGKATMVLQGHYHKGAERVIDGIPYVTFCAMCEGTDNAYRIVELA